jgi:hypothetical protein
MTPNLKHEGNAGPATKSYHPLIIVLHPLAKIITALTISCFRFGVIRALVTLLRVLDCELSDFVMLIVHL